jgi:penicillin-insensitive murein DD-endopeptidase
VRSLALAVPLLIALTAGAASASRVAISTCYGTVRDGGLENGVKLPWSGKNYSAYSTLGAIIGRTHVHAKVRGIVLSAYGALEQAAPGKVFVYGETGWASGGRIRPHRTHRNGLSVDFMVPILDAAGHSIPLPTGPLNWFGYGIDFDAVGRFGAYAIDFEAMGEHLFQLHRAAAAREAGIALVIFDPRLMPRLLASARGPFLKQSVNFLKGEAWVRHDEHYHVDFAVPCRPSHE